MKLDDPFPQTSNPYRFLPYTSCIVQSILSERICKKYHLYFASLVMLCNHLMRQAGSNFFAQMYQTRENCSLLERQIMAIIANEENGECAEWINEDCLELNETSSETTRHKNHALPIYSLNEHLSSLWENQEQTLYHIADSAKHYFIFYFLRRLF